MSNIEERIENYKAKIADSLKNSETYFYFQLNYLGSDSFKHEALAISDVSERTVFFAVFN